LSGATTISGATTLSGATTAISGTTTITGNIVANALTITPTELGYLDGASSNLQTQITARALDSAVVHKTGDETIDGAKIFTGTTAVAQRNSTNNIQFANANIGLGYSFIDLCSGGNADYDVRLASGDGTATQGRGNFVIEAGTIRNYSITSNTLEVNGSEKIKTTVNTTTLSNTTTDINSGDDCNITSVGDNVIIAGTNYLTATNNVLTAGLLGYNRLAGETYVAYNSGTNHIRTGNIPSYTFIDFLSGGGSGIATSYDVRLASDGFGTSFAQGSFGIECLRISLNNNSMINYMIAGTPDAFNTSSFQMLLGNHPDNAVSNPCYKFSMPYKCRLVGWSIAGDTDLHSAIAMRFRVSTGLNGLGTVYYDQQGNLSANALTSHSCCMDLNGNVLGWTSVSNFNTGTTIPAGIELSSYVNTSSSMNCEFNIKYFFQQM
jgi:hypothetical protein